MIGFYPQAFKKTRPLFLAGQMGEDDGYAFRRLLKLYSVGGDAYDLLLLFEFQRLF